MEPIYTDIHIHTSENPNILNQNYDIDTLFAKVRQIANGANAIISFTDHNTINERAYLSALTKCGNDIHMLLGVELHIHYNKSTEAYHCHLLFKDEIASKNIQSINKILDKLYPNKVVERKDESIPTLDEVINNFDNYDFVLLPHGGQSHATFDKAIPKGARFDTMMERSVYYNQFDGFTARSDKGREETDNYFRRLGISSFVNLVTCSDNYDPSKYPATKVGDTSPFIPTWIFAEPTFEGFRLTLSENSRLTYSETKPEFWSENIESARCLDEKLDIDVKFNTGLNVVIGGSSSGKTLLVDSICRKLRSESFESSPYVEFGVANMDIVNPSGKYPHYLNQNFIMKVVGDDDAYNIEDIDIIKSLFPNNKEITKQVNDNLSKLKSDITELMQTVEDIKRIEDKLNTTSQIGRLLVYGIIKKNIISPFIVNESERQKIQYNESKRVRHIKTLKEIREVITQNPLVIGGEEKVDELIELLDKIFKYSEIEDSVHGVINDSFENYATQLKIDSYENQTKSKEFKDLLGYISEYVFLNRKFKKKLDEIANYDFNVATKEIVSAEHHLFISNLFKMNKNKVLDVFNSLLKSRTKIDSFEAIRPKSLYEQNFSKQRPKVNDYKDFVVKACGEFEAMNKTRYKIITKDGQEFENLSAGWKTSVLLDLILGYDKDNAPIVIDQPEDNLATKYINDGLVTSIKKVKRQKQIILVSHNATIPMMGDAQQIIYCENKQGKVIIRSAPLEGEIDGKPVLDLIASITDGGKSSIKKRVKKYNLKKFTE